MCVCSLSPVPLFCDHMVCSLPGSTVHELFQARILAATATAKSLQSCPTLCDPIDGSPPGSSVSGILQTRTLEWCCHFLLQCMKVKSESEVAQSCPTQRPHGLQPTRLLHPWDFPGKWVAIVGVAVSSSRGSSWYRDRTWVSCISCIGRWILYHCTTWVRGSSSGVMLMFYTR